MRCSFRSASAIAHKADGDGTTLRDAAMAEGVDAKEFDEFVDVGKMAAQAGQALEAVCSNGHKRVARGNIAAKAAFTTSRVGVAIAAS